MKKVVWSYIFVLLYLAAMLRPVLPLIEYTIKYDYYAQVLCINKDKPKMQCNGKCQLSKKLAQEANENSNEENPAPQINLKDFPVTSTHSKDYILTAICTFNRPTFNLYISSKIKKYIDLVFRPPKVLV